MISAPSLSTWIEIGRLVGDHLWQSTLFAALAGLLTLAFRNPRAQVRHALWLAASLKFLIPFAALVAVGSRFGWHRVAPLAQNPAPFVIDMDTMSQPFSRLAAATASAVVSHSMFVAVPILLFAIWLCGFAAILLISWMRLRRVVAAVREGSPARQGRELDLVRRVKMALGITQPVPLVLSNKSVEPYVFGIVNPVLLWPQSISKHLTDAQMEAILAHELSHVRRRDNLAAAAHLLVESLFWFHPLVWWLGARMVDERERACDEEVLRLGAEPLVYADGILKICEFYLGSPIACVAGVTGSDLKKRMERIMRNRIGETLNGWRKLFLATAGVAALALPIVVGVLTTSRLRAQSTATTAELPKFEVASVKVNKSGSPNLALRTQPGGRVTAVNLPLRLIIADAYNLPFGQANNGLIGLPNWNRSERFDIEAKADGNPTDEQVRLMLRSLLADRFRLAVHWETRQLPIYALTMVESGKLGPQLFLHIDNAHCFDTSSGPQSGPFNLWLPPCGVGGFADLTGRVIAEATMEELAKNLSWFRHSQTTEGIDRTVVDQTGLTGTFDLTINYKDAPLQPAAGLGTNASGSDSWELPEIYRDLKEQLGLKLEPQMGPGEFLVIDHVEEPSPN